MENPLKLKRIHHVEFWVGNARQAAYFYRKGFGFSQVAYSGLETGQRERTSYALSQGKANFVLTTPMTPDDSASEHIRKHGDGVRDIALEVDDADEAFEEAVRRGAQPAEEPHEIKDEHGAIRRGAVHTYGDTIHSLISYKDYKGPFLPGYMAAPLAADDCGILRIDHIVGNVELGKMQYWADYYTRVFGFHRYITFDDKDISTEYSALMSIVMSDDSHSVKFPINEPAPARNKSQIQEYIEAYGGAGAQHIALQCKDVRLHGRQVAAQRARFSARSRHVLRCSAVAGRAGAGIVGRVALARYTCGPRRRGVPAADFLEAGGGSTDGVFRSYPAQGQPRIWQRKFQSAV
jgi:4-hydroxyphenylpyruvate dioxygenase